jgi:glycosyltransferase involved in cell wall biosynthesis
VPPSTSQIHFSSHGFDPAETAGLRLKHLVVLMVTGAYPPEISGAGLQCRVLINALKDRVGFVVLTTTSEASLGGMSLVDGVPVYRVVVRETTPARLWAGVVITWRFLRLRRRIHAVHLHGFSSKMVLVILLARWFGKPIIQKMTSVGHDDPEAIRRRGRLPFWLYRAADVFVAISPRLVEIYRSSGLPQEKLRHIPNAVDSTRFRPPRAGEQAALRRELRLPATLVLILFVGFFSREKGPQTLVEAWLRLDESRLPTTGIVFVGASRSRYYEIDPELAPSLRRRARAAGREARLFFVETTPEIEKYYRAADIFVLASTREGLPNALLEAMASELPCVASLLPGVTDTVIEDGVTGFLFPPGDVGTLTALIGRLLRDRKDAANIGAAAREGVGDRYGIEQVASQYLSLYRSVTVTPPGR